MIRLGRQPGHSSKREVYRNGDTEAELLRGAYQQAGEELQRVPATLILRKGGREHRMELIGKKAAGIRYQTKKPASQRVLFIYVRPDYWRTFFRSNT